MCSSTPCFFMHSFISSLCCFRRAFCSFSPSSPSLNSWVFTFAVVIALSSRSACWIHELYWQNGLLQTATSWNSKHYKLREFSTKHAKIERGALYRMKVLVGSQEVWMYSYILSHGSPVKGQIWNQRALFAITSGGSRGVSMSFHRNPFWKSAEYELEPYWFNQ